jgi:hypothetical protein
VLSNSSSLASSARLNNSVPPQNVCNRAFNSPLGRFLIDKYNLQMNIPGFNINNSSFSSGILICEFSFSNISNELILQISINADNIRAPQYWCRLNISNGSNTLQTNDNNTFTCTQYKIVINLQAKTIIHNTNQLLLCNAGGDFYWKSSPTPALVSSRTNNSRISPPGFNTWVSIVIDNVDSEFLTKDRPNGSKRYVLEFFEGETKLIQIYILNGKYYLYWSKMPGTIKDIKIKKDASGNFYVEGNSASGRSGNTFKITFNNDEHNLLTYTQNSSIQNLHLKENGFKFENGTNV